MAKKTLRKKYRASIGDAWWIGTDYYQRTSGKKAIDVNSSRKKESLKCCDSCEKVYEVERRRKADKTRVVFVYFFYQLHKRGLKRVTCPDCLCTNGSRGNLVVIEG